MKSLMALILSLNCVFQLVGCTNTTVCMTDEEVGEVVIETDVEKTTHSETWDLIPMVMVHGTLYLDTGHDSTVKGRCGVMDGKITSQVDGSQQPTMDDQSNFGIGYGYQYGMTEGTIEIYMNDQWRIFATEEVRQEIQFSED